MEAREPAAGVSKPHSPFPASRQQTQFLDLATLARLRAAGPEEGAGDGHRHGRHLHRPCGAVPRAGAGDGEPRELPGRCGSLSVLVLCSLGTSCIRQLITTWYFRAVRKFTSGYFGRLIESLTTIIDLGSNPVRYTLYMMFDFILPC